MKILLTGANGQVGWELTQKKLPPSYSLFALTREQFDITHKQQVQKALADYQPDLLINTAAYTAVDKAEHEEATAFTINHLAVGILAEACAQKNVPLIHLSTDYIFDGVQRNPYKETDHTNPLNVYGKSKLAAETTLRTLWEKHIILRVSGVFSTHGYNFVKTILRLAQEKETLHIVNDQTLCPTPAAAIAETIIKISQPLFTDSASWGTYHYSSNEPTTWFHFTEAIIAIAKKYKSLKLKEILPITTAEYPTPAKRPVYSVLDCTKLQSVFNIEACSWHEGLEKVIKELLA